MSVAPELKRERDYLAGARAELTRMRERTLSLKAHGGDKVSSEFLATTLYRRALSLIDDPASSLFFGRIDQQRSDAPEPERWYIGRRHVADSHGNPVVIDWRADVSTAFYRASRTEPMGVSLRRRFGIDRGQLTAYEDERLDREDENAAPAGPAFRSQILAGEIERPRVGPMRDIVATIQPEQDSIVRADVSTTVCVQGAPGTGKTAVGLHRAAWLLYAFRERLARTGVLVIGPNRAFLDHIGAVLPALGEVEVRHCTIDELLASVPVRGKDSVDTAVLKGDSRLAEILRDCSVVARPDAHGGTGAAARRAQVARAGIRRGRDRAGAEDPRGEVRRSPADAASPARPRDPAADGAGRRLPRRPRAGCRGPFRCGQEICQSGVARARPEGRAVQPALGRHRPAEARRRSAQRRGTLNAVVGQPSCRPRIGPVVAGRRRPARRDQRPPPAHPSLGHVILDEAQDLSPMQLRAVGRRCSTGSATVLGDLAQGTTPWATDSWEVSLGHLGKPDGVIEILVRGFRVPASVIDYAAQLLPSMAPGLGAPVSVRDNPGRLEIVRVDGAALYDRVAGSVVENAREPGSVGVIVPDAAVDAVSKALSRKGIDHGVLGADHGDVDHQVDVIPATVAKGLEFDRVIVVEPSAIAAAEPDRRTGLRRLYVVLTRAVSELTVVHADELPVELAGLTD